MMAPEVSRALHWADDKEVNDHADDEAGRHRDDQPQEPRSGQLADRQRDIGREHRLSELREIHHPGRAPHQNKRQRHQSDDCSGGNTAQQIVDEVDHSAIPPFGAQDVTSGEGRNGLPGLVAEVRMTQLLVLCNLLGRSALHDLPQIENDPGLRHAKSRRRVLLHEQYRQARVASHQLDEFQNLGDDQRCETERGLIEQERLRPGHEGATNRQLLPFSPTQGVGSEVSALTEHGNSA